MEIVASKIKEFFNNNPNLSYMVFQEMPGYNDKTIAGEKLQDLIRGFFQAEDPWANAVKRVLSEGKLDLAKILHLDTDKLRMVMNEALDRVPEGDTTKLLKNLTALKKNEMLALEKAGAGDKAAALEAKNANQAIEMLLRPKVPEKDLFITFFKPLRPPAQTKLNTEISKTDYRKNMEPDVALVARGSAPRLSQETSDYDSRLVPWCSKQTKKCYSAAHMPQPNTDAELKIRCVDLKNFALHLKNKGYDSIAIAGDFNTNASRIAKVCKDILPVPDGNVELHTSAGEKGNSCAGPNKGALSHFNIDIMIKYNFPVAK